MSNYDMTTEEYRASLKKPRKSRAPKVTHDPFAPLEEYACKPLRVELPLPESVNAMYRPNGRGGRLLTDDAKRFKTQSILLAQNAAQLTGWRAPQFLKIEYWFFVPSGKNDGDNLIKITQDALAQALGFNDNRVVSGVWEMRTQRDNPRCIAILTEATWPTLEA